MVKTNRSWEPRKKPLQGRSRETVGFVLEAAAQLFGELGYEGTTKNRIADRAGVSIGSVYQYFPNKEALLMALAERHLDKAREYGTAALRRLREQKPTPEECSIVLGKGVVEMQPGSLKGLQLVVEDVRAARTELVDRGVEIGEVQVLGASGSRPARDGEDLNHVGFAFFNDPDGNGWAIQEINTRS